MIEYRRDSKEIAKETRQTLAIAKFKETRRKSSVGKKNLPKYHNNNNINNLNKDHSNVHNIFYAPNRPSPKSIDYFQNRPRSAVTQSKVSTHSHTQGMITHERTNSNGSGCSSNSKKMFTSYKDCKSAVSGNITFLFYFNNNIYLFQLSTNGNKALNQMRCWPFNNGRSDAKEPVLDWY